MKRMILFALVLNAALLGVVAHQLVAIAGDGPEAAQNGDTNGDGQRDVSDAIHLLSWLFLGGQEPVPVVCAQAGGMLKFNVPSAVTPPAESEPREPSAPAC